MMDTTIDNADYKDQKLRADKEGGLTLADPTLIEGVDEYGDGITLQILGAFPTFVVQQIQNAIAVRQVLPRVSFTSINVSPSSMPMAMMPPLRGLS